MFTISTDLLTSKFYGLKEACTEHQLWKFCAIVA